MVLSLGQLLQTYALPDFALLQVCVRALDTLTLEHVLPQPSGGVRALLAAGDCVLGGVGRECVVWGCGKTV